MASTIHSRIAPTPSGYLHIGNALNFIITWLWVRKENGILRLRIDDLDAPRARPEYLEDIFRTLEWLGLDWDEGPQTPEEQKTKYSQQLGAERYEELIAQLITTGKVFACECSRKEIQNAGQYPGTCRYKHLPLDTPDTTLRILIPESTTITVPDVKQGNIAVNLYNEMRDFVIRRRDGIAAYQIASLADDADYHINLIIRGKDLLQSTTAQLYLAQLCGLNSFKLSTFYHHPLLKDEEGNKLSKSAGSASLRAWRETDATPERFYRMISKILGWTDEVGTLEEMLQGVKEGWSLLVK